MLSSFRCVCVEAPVLYLCVCEWVMWAFSLPLTPRRKFCGCMCVEKMLSLRLCFFWGKSYKDNLFPRSVGAVLCVYRERERESDSVNFFFFFRFHESLKRDSKQLKLLPQKRPAVEQKPLQEVESGAKSKVRTTKLPVNSPGIKFNRRRSETEPTNV